MSNEGYSLPGIGANDMRFHPSQNTQTPQAGQSVSAVRPHVTLDHIDGISAEYRERFEDLLKVMGGIHSHLCQLSDHVGGERPPSNQLASPGGSGPVPTPQHPMGAIEAIAVRMRLMQPQFDFADVLIVRIKNEIDRINHHIRG